MMEEQGAVAALVARAALVEKYRRGAEAGRPGGVFLYFMKASMSTSMRFPVVVTCKPVLHTDMVTMARRWRPLFPLGVEHLHEQRLRGGAAVAVLLVQVLLAARGQRVDLG